ncbi:MAG: hypothetical protein LKI53_05080 [Bacteroidales bacterium]|jgi:hypothetical protein|nr:hypothetical protein [Bacteroidales bacterium]
MKFCRSRIGNAGILLLCLIFAFLFWIFRSLGNDYSAVLDFKVKIKSNLEGRVPTSSSQSMVIIKGTCSGLYITKQRSGMAPRVLDLEVDHTFLHKSGNGSDSYYITSKDLRPIIQKALGEDLRINWISTDAVYFDFPVQDNKRVPVVSRIDIRCKSQYTMLGSIRLKPDSVIVYGNAEAIASIDSVFTRDVEVNEASSQVEGVVRLEKIGGIRFSDNEIYYHADVRRFTENSVKVNVNVTDAPSNVSVIIVPSAVSVTYREVFGRRAKTGFSDLQVAVDFNKISGSFAIPEIHKMPDGIFDVSIDPPYVQCVVNNN